MRPRIGNSAIYIIYKLLMFDKPEQMHAETKTADVSRKHLTPNNGLWHIQKC